MKTRFTAERIANVDIQIDAMLANEPPVVINSNRKLVDAYAGRIKACLDKGWPIESILEKLGKAGFTMTERTLRTYLQRSLAKQGRKDEADFNIEAWLDHPERILQKRGQRPARSGS